MNEQLTSRFLEPRDDGNTYYTGPLAKAQAVANKDRFSHITFRKEGYLLLELTDDPAGGNVSEWGAGITEEVAWRYALGAYFGPLDEEYPGDEYVKALLDQTTTKTSVEPEHEAVDLTKPHGWNADVCDDKCQHVEMVFDTDPEYDGAPYTYLIVNGQRSLRFNDPYAITGLVDMLTDGAAQLAVKLISYFDGIPEELVLVRAKLAEMGTDVQIVSLDQVLTGSMGKVPAIDKILTRVDDTEESAHCEDCGHWLDAKGMCPSCLPNSQRNPDERVDE